MSDKALTDEQIKAAAEAAGLEYAALKAVAVVEASGAGFLPDGRPKILFEGHIFWRQLSARGIDPVKFVFEFGNILHPDWDKSQYKGGAAEHQRLQRAAAINADAAHCSASWGLFQVMGFNWKLCGFVSLNDFLNAMRRDEAGHLEAALGYIKASGLIPALKSLDWPAFAKGYNGPGYAANQYDVKLARAYAEAKKKVW
jgi:hypothetical protein